MNLSNPPPADVAAFPAAPAVVPALPDAERMWRLYADAEGLRVREANLRAYEARLRRWQEQLDTAGRPPARPDSQPPAGGSGSPFAFPGNEELRAAWEKFHRAHALLQAEQHQLLDERRILREAEAALRQREARVAAREQQLALRAG